MGNRENVDIDFVAVIDDLISSLEDLRATLVLSEEVDVPKALLN